MELDARILLDVLIVLVGAKLGGELAERLRQPPVLGELVVGVLLGAGLLGGRLGLPDLATAGGATDIVLFLAELGAILLLFNVGLESDLSALRRVGASSVLVAAIGMVASFVAGYAASFALAMAMPAWHAANEALPPHLLHAFVGATLTATSVGITARVLGDLRRLQSPEARVILGAAVLDDIGGLLVLAIITAMVQASAGGGLDGLAIAWIAAKAIGFLVASLLVGLYVVPRLYDFVIDRARVRGLSVTLAIAFALAMAYMAHAAQLATIVGAFAAGLILAGSRHAQKLDEQLDTFSTLFVAFFFVTIGMRADLTRLDGHGAAVLLVGLTLAAVAIAAKLACGWGVIGNQARHWPVAVGMVPRGEVGFIFASFGLAPVLGSTQGLISGWQYTALVLVVLLTTLVTPIWLRRLTHSFTGPLDEKAAPRRDVGELP